MLNICHVLSGLKVGGAEMMLLNLIKNSSSNLSHCVLVLSPEGDMLSRFEAIGVSVIVVDFKKRPIHSFIQLVKIFSEVKPDIVQTWLYHADLLGGLAAKLAGIKHIIWGIRTTELKKGSYITASIRKLCAWLSYTVPSKIVVVAAKSKRKHIELGYDASKMLVIPNGFNVEAFNASSTDDNELKQAFGISENDLVIGCVGRLSQVKGQDVFIQAAGLVLEGFPEIKFLMVGRGLESNNESVVSMIRQYANDDNFILLGERSDVPVCLSAMNIFCLPSRSEGFPNALGEAMLAGVPCVSTDAGDASVLGGADVPIAEVDNPVDLANQLIYMIEKTPQERYEIGQRLRQRIIDEYSIEKMVSRYNELYSELQNQDLKGQAN
ncbi:glycosyltransferase family 4 protein [Thiomicrorhabdus chilensis]|uniref:glycosyltransferase family 4 protein n=1 Tax=Thiomicrorhabdus chilensis TaxID=63656 RepID=UPI000417E8B4|nr:glycosyltransferase [Thiomicrorhabdus chilensis]